MSRGFGSRGLANAALFAGLLAAAPSFADEPGGEPARDEARSEKSEASVDHVVEAAGVNIAFGPLVASRAMQMRVDAGEVVHEPGLYFGGTARLAVELVEFDSFDALLLFEAEGGYGASRNREAVAELRREPVTEWSFLDARITVRRPLTEAFDLDVGLGAYANSFIVEPNLTYTGHRYIAADVRLGLGWHDQSTSWSAALDLSAHPVIAVDQSSGVHGESTAFGARAGAQVGYNIAQVESTGGYTGGRLMLRYDYTRFRTQFPQKRVTLDGGVSEDDVHALTLMFGYFM